MNAWQSTAAPMAEEDALVGELELLGVTYLSRREDCTSTQVRAPDQLLADLARQPSARVREAIIALLLAHPEYASAVPDALTRLSPADQMTMRLFYTAAVLLQEENAEALRQHLTATWQPLPDLFSLELGLPQGGSHRERLARLGYRHRQLTGASVNWAGTYSNVARHLIRRLELERRWNR